MEKQKKFIRHELLKMYEDGHTTEQMIEKVKRMWLDWEVSVDDIIEALVVSRWNDIMFKKRILEVKEILKFIW